MNRRIGEVRKTSRGRRWECFCLLDDGSKCPECGYGADEAETLAGFEKHYAAKHMEGKG